MNKIIKVFVMMVLTLCILSACDEPAESKTGVVINEICSSNQSSYPTSDYKYYDWIELFNTTDEDIYLKQYGISDDENELFKFSMPSVTIKAKSYLIVFFNALDQNRDKLIAGFGLSSSGESVYLTMPNGNICDSVTFPRLTVDTTYGNYNGGYEILNPTPNEANESKPLYNHVNAPVFSKETGFYSSDFKLTLTSDLDTKIYYTLDSSMPTTESLEYTGSIEITDPSKQPNILKSREDITSYENKFTDCVDKAMIVRAIAVSSDGNVSDVVTHSYFVKKTKYKSKNVISLVTDNYNLLDEEYGIYVKGKTHEKWIEDGSKGYAEYNWSNKGREWEREFSLSYLEEGKEVFTQDCGVRIHGYGGRNNPIKSFNVYARSCYGEDYFKNPIFDGATKTKSFVLKYDRYSSSTEKFRDGFVQSLVEETNVTTQEYEQCVVFLNGEYWETYSAMQKYTDDFIEDEYGINKNDAVIIKDGELEEGTEEDLKEYKELISFVKKNNFANDKNYKKFASMVDIDSLIDYYATQIYLNNFDFSTRKDFVVWKSKNSSGGKYQDGLWRFMIYDMDTTASKLSFRTDDGLFTYDYTFDTLTGDFLYAGDLKEDIFLTSLMKNEMFKEKFTTRFMDLCNTVFEKDNVKNKLKTEYNLTSGIMVDFFNNRFEHISKHYANYIETPCDLKLLKVESDSAYIINTLNMSSSYSGYYYSSMYLTLETDKNYLLTDLEVVSEKDNVVTLKIIGNNPTIKIS